MPRRAPKACRVQGCGGLATASHGYCDKHSDRAKAWSRGRGGRGRGGREWRRIREQIKERANGLCEECLRHGRLTPGQVCDHVVPEAEGGTTTDDNLQWLCQSCHDKKTQEESRRGRDRIS
ncbi:HNH endonuclease signature motif containing protein [Neptuniibacter sp.]|uniref:HNH endonuclease n=1 Tax=Neptuniibacter sp. TaxID=1962643 RepID=UPI00261DB763|nr:HNH endonuclease signature motif containing protein [Neptuniibacter sp.]MCP4595746.1 HNH endonuclease [Neptuniibacter sp.]